MSSYYMKPHNRLSFCLLQTFSLDKIFCQLRLEMDYLQNENVKAELHEKVKMMLSLWDEWNIKFREQLHFLSSQSLVRC